MTPHELHQTAAFLRERYEPPIPTMTPGTYVSHEAMHALADALDRTGDAVAETAVAVAPSPDDSYLRALGLEQAVKASLGFGGGDDLIRATASLVAYLRDGTVPPDPHLGVAKTVDGPGQPGAPAALHEAIDRAWRSVVEDGDRLAVDSDGDEEVLEQLRLLTDSEIARTSFVQAIVRSLAQAVRAERAAFGDER